MLLVPDWLILKTFRVKMQNKDQGLICDFVDGPVGYRFRQGGGRSQALPKAVGLKGKTNLHIIDATAGLGRDAFLLASLGANVTMIERNPQMHSLLHDAMVRAKNESYKYAEVIERMTLIHGDAIELLPSIKPKIVIIDPMHPPRSKSALVKKEMRIIRDIVGTDEDAGKLMNVALKYATKRVVLKWPQHARPMDELPRPSHQITGKSTRYDVFIRI
jgi:16S rRNA (guanine1516-N2)-methyltransferase